LISRYKPNEVIYPPGSACESLYILHEGQVQLLDPLKNMKAFATLTPGDSFSRMEAIATRQFLGMINNLNFGPDFS
jgi:CRP-like cAMP-binding protein